MNIKPVSELVKEAGENIENLSPEQAAEILKTGNAVLIDLREPIELKEHGFIEGSVLAVRGPLEFYADPTSSLFNEAFNPSRKIILHCAAGLRSALAVHTLRQMGYPDVAHIQGGIKAWKEQGLPVKYKSANK